MSVSRETLLARIHDALAELILARTTPEELPPGVSPAHIDWCLEHFRAVEGHVASGYLPARAGRKSLLARLQTDSWPWDWPLGVKLSKIEADYYQAEF